MGFRILNNNDYFSRGDLEFSATTSSIQNNIATSLTNNSIVLDSAEGSDLSMTPEITVTATPSGEIDGNISDGEEVRLGGILITIGRV